MSSTAVSVLSLPGLSSDAECSSTVIYRPSSPATLGQPRLHCASIARHAVAEDQVENGGDRIAGRAGNGGCPFRIDARDLDRTEKIENADNEDQRGVLEQADIGVDDVRNRHGQGLRQHDEPYHLRVA